MFLLRDKLISLRGKENQDILAPRAHDPSDLWQGSRAVNRGLFGLLDFLSTSWVFEKARALDPCHRPEGSWALGTRMESRVFEGSLHVTDQQQQSKGFQRKEFGAYHLINHFTMFAILYDISKAQRHFSLLPTPARRA